MGKMPSSKYMHLVNDKIQEKRTTLETIYLNNATHLHESTLKLKQQVNNTITISVETLKNIASVIDMAAQYVQEINPNHTGSIGVHVKEKQNIVEFGNDTIRSAFQPHYMTAEKLSRNASRLLKIIEINTNQARKVNLEFCLIEPKKPLRISCLQNIQKFYEGYLIRVRNALKTYNEFNNSVQRKIENATRTTVIRTFQKAHGSARTVVKNMFGTAEITPDAVMRHTQQRVAHYRKAIQSYIPRSNEKLKLIRNVYTNFYQEYDNYEAIFSYLKNMALLAVDIIVYSKNVTDAELDYVNKGLSEQSRLHFSRLVDYYSGLKHLFESINNQIFIIEEKFRQLKPVNISCNDTVSDVAYLFDCVQENIVSYTELLNTTKNVYNISKAVTENILENADIFNRKVHDDFSLEVYNLTLSLIKEYDLDVADIFSYKQKVVEKKYDNILSAVNRTSKKCNDEFLEEVEAKVTAVITIVDIINKIIHSCEDSDNENVMQARQLLTQLNETIASQYDTGFSNIHMKTGNITEYAVENKVNDIVTTMDEEKLAEKCSINNSSSMNVVKVAQVLQCVDGELTKFNYSMNAVAGDYVTLTSELEEINALFLHDMQAALRNGIRNVLPLIRDKHPACDVLTCLNSVDIRKSNSTRLEADLDDCSAIIAE